MACRSDLPGALVSECMIRAPPSCFLSGESESIHFASLSMKKEYNICDESTNRA